MFRQRSIQNLVRTTGVGVHSGRRVELTLRPAQPNTGIVFHRVDLPQVVDLPAQATGVGDTRMASVLQQGNVRVSTVEHLMSALAGLGIDNLHIDLTAEEVPIMDGSAATFVYLLRSAGIVEQNAPKRFIRIRKPVEVRDGDKLARFTPYDGFRLEFTVKFDHPAIPEALSRATLDFSTGDYIREISRARTFGFMRDIEMLREHNLALGGSMDNAVVLDDYRVLNEDGLRYEDEFVRHKISRRHRRPLPARPQSDRRLLRPQVGPRAQQQAPAYADRPAGCVGGSELRGRSGHRADFLRPSRAGGLNATAVSQSAGGWARAASRRNSVRSS